jgi:nitrite reductase (NO-forming)
VQPFTRYDPVLPPVEAGPKEITIVAKDATLTIAKDVPYAAWTFDGTVPGRALRVVQGDEISFTLQIDPNATTAHSMDFHSAQTPPNVNYKTILRARSSPGASLRGTPGPTCIIAARRRY